MRDLLLSSSRKGQSIVEAMVALSILMIGLMGVLTLLSRSLLLQRATGDRAKATYLAAEGIEIAKSLIDHDVYLGIASHGGTGGWMTCFPSPSGDYDLDFASKGCPPDFSSDKPLLFSPSTGFYYSDADIGAPSDAVPTNFVRSITIVNNQAADPNEIDVRSTVTWDTGAITQQKVVLEDHFYNWRPIN